MRGIIILIAMAVASAAVQPLYAQQQSPKPEMECGGTSTSDYSCRSFIVESGDYVETIEAFKAEKFTTRSVYDGRALLDEKVAELSSELATVLRDPLWRTDQSVLIKEQVEQSHLTYFVLRDVEYVAVWTVVGTNFDILPFFESVYRASTDVTAGRQSRAYLLPDVAEFPNGFSKIDEAIYFPETVRPTAAPTPTPSMADLEATIEALEAENRELKDRIALAPTVQPTSAPADNNSVGEDDSVLSGPLLLLDISTKSTGLGDGSLYVYVDVMNTTTRTLGYVQVDVTCRDSNGGVVGTGIGNTLNLGAGQPTTLTAIILSAPTCESVEVKTNPLTGAY